MTSILPIKVLSVSITDVEPFATWDSDDGTGDPWIGYPYQWTVTLNVTATPNSSFYLPSPFAYTGTDIVIGDWICSNLSGMACKVVSIVGTLAQNVVTLIIEDVDRFNTITDPSSSGSGGPVQGPGFIFELNEDGLPILTGLSPSSFPGTFATDLIGRFSYRNLNQKYIRKYQTPLTLNVGDFIFLDVDGIYKNISSTNATSTNLQKVIGKVTSINTPGLGYFTFEPKGSYRNDINPPLPGSIGGCLVYIDSTSSIAGSLTTLAPSSNPTPVYIQLDSPTEGIYLLGGAGFSSSGTSGGSSGSAGDLIINPGNTTEVITDLSGYANEVVVKANNQLITEFKANSGSLTSTLNEHLVVSNSLGLVKFSAIDSTGTNNVNLNLYPQGNGYVGMGTSGPGLIDASPGNPLTVQGGSDTLTTSAGNLYLTGGNAANGYNNAGNVYIYGGSASLGVSGIVAVQDSFQHNILEFLGNSSELVNWLQVSNAPSTILSTLGSVQLNVATDSADTDVGVLMAPKGQGLLRVGNPSIYNTVLATDTGIDALVTKGYLSSLMPGTLNGSFLSNYSIGIGLSTLSNILNVNLGTTTVTINSHNNLIVNSSSYLHQVLHSAGATGTEATWGYTTRLHDTLGNTIIVATAQVNPVNYLSIQSSTTNSPVLISAVGTDASISIVLSPKGTGFIQANSGYTAKLQSSTLIPTEAFITAGYMASFAPSTGSATVSSVNSLTGLVTLTASNIYASYTPTYYSTTANDIQDHLEGIDTELGILSSASFSTSLVSDLSPQLGGNLDVNGFIITSTQINGNIVLQPNGNGVITLGTFSIPNTTGSLGETLISNGAGSLTWTTPSAIPSLTSQLVNNSGYLSVVPTLEQLSDVSAGSLSAGQVLQYNGSIWTSVTLASAFDGNYNHLTNLPTIPSLVTQLSNNAGYITTSPSVTLYGDAFGSGTTSIQVSLASITPSGTYSKVYVNTKGQVTLGGSLSSNDVTTALGYTPINASLAGVANGIATLDGTGKVPTSQLPAAVIGAVVYQGVWNASTNQPTITSGIGTKGYYYKVNVAGYINIDGIDVWNVDDTIIFDGTTWDKISGIDPAVFQVNGQTGNITLNVSSLNDVTLTGVTAGQILSWNGSLWVNTTASSAGSFSGSYLDLTNTPTIPSLTSQLVDNSGFLTAVPSINIASLVGVAITSPSLGQVLQYNGSSWINTIASSFTSTLGVAQGGTGLTSVSAGNLLYASATNTLSTLSIGSAGQVLTVVAGSIAWSTPATSGGGGAYISTGSTKVDTSTGSNTVQISTGTLSAEFQSSNSATSGEMLVISNTAGAALVSAASPNGTSTVNLVLSAQGGGSVQVLTSGNALISSAAGQSLTIQPGSSIGSTGAVLTISGGNALSSGQNGGNLVLQGGSSGSGGSNGQVTLPSNYSPSLSTSVVSKGYVDNNLNTFVIVSSGNYSVLTTDYLIIVRKTSGSATTISLPSGASAGTSKRYIIKDGKGDAATNNITIIANGSNTIDGATSQVINTVYGKIQIFWDGTTWNVI